jgi:hypothetical protein
MKHACNSLKCIAMIKKRYLVEIVNVSFAEVISESLVVADLREQSLQLQGFLRKLQWSTSSDLQFHRVTSLSGR